MRDIRIAAAQFEARDADKDYNFGRIEAPEDHAARIRHRVDRCPHQLVEDEGEEEEEQL